MVDANKPSIKKKRRLQLIGPDDQYAKRDAVKDQRSSQETKKPVSETKKPPIKKEQVAPQPVSSDKIADASPPQSIEQRNDKSEQVPVNIRLPVGEKLSKRLTEIANKYNQPIEPIIKTARKRAAERFKELVLIGKKPEATEFETGGEVTRFAATFSGAAAEKINKWFDPFNLGVAKDGIKPVMARLLQEEIVKICDAVE